MAPHVSYVDPATVTNPELLAIMERARTFGTPRPESQVDEILDFERSDRFDARERTALEWAMAIAWDPGVAADDPWDRLHEHFSEPELVELGHFVALTLGQQRFLKTVAIKHGEVLADTEAGLAPAQAGRLRAERASAPR